MIFTVLTAFICLTVQLFYLINNIRCGFQNPNAVVASGASCSLIFMHTLELWVVFISGQRVKDVWSKLVKRVFVAKRKFTVNKKLKAQIDELVSIMLFTRIEIKAAGLFNIDLSVITSVSDNFVSYLDSSRTIRTKTLTHLMSRTIIVSFRLLFNQQIVSSIATYLVVLVQFKMSEEEVSNNITRSRDDLQQYEATLTKQAYV